MTPVNDWYTFGIPAPADPGLARQSPGTGTQPVMDRFAYKLPPRTRTRSGVTERVAGYAELGTVLREIIAKDRRV